MKYKTCNVCGKRLINNIENFYTAISNKDGLTKDCKECNRRKTQIYKMKNRKKVLEHQAKYRKNNKEKVIESNLNYRKNNILKERERARKYHQTPRGKALSIINCHKKKARLKGVKADFTIEQWIACKQYFDNSCAYCGSKISQLELEHVTPKIKNGGFTASNILCACRKCNNSKSDKYFIEWYPGQNFYSEVRNNSITSYLKSKKA